jgi:hypothetical protein
MSDEYEFYQGLVLRQLVTESELSLILRPFVREGRINAFVLNGKYGVFIKHSAKRMSPWRFTFNLDQASDLLDLEARLMQSFVVFVCGDDGVVTLNVATLHQIVSFQESEHAWVRIERKPRSQYGVAGNRADLQNKVPNGTAPIHEAILEAVRGRQVS